MKIISVKLTHELRYFFNGFKLIGISPYAETKNWRIVLLLYSLILLGVVILICCSAFIIANIFNQSSAGTLASIVGELMFCGLLATTVIILFQAVIFRSEAIQIEDRFDTIHRLMQKKLSVDISIPQMQRKLLFKIMSIVVFLVVVTGINFLALAHFEEPLSYNVHSLFPIIIVRGRCIHNIFLVDLLTIYLNFLNAKLEFIIEVSARNAENVAVFKYAHTDFGHLVRSPNAELMFLKDVYGYIWDITNLINDAFGWSLLAVATQNFIEFTCNGYWLFLAMEDKITGVTAISKWGNRKIL